MGSYQRKLSSGKSRPAVVSRIARDRRPTLTSAMSVRANLPAVPGFFRTYSANQVHTHTYFVGLVMWPMIVWFGDSFSVGIKAIPGPD